MDVENKIEGKKIDQIVLERDELRENFVHDMIIGERDVQNDIMSILNLSDFSKMELIHEDKYINGITADFTLLYDKAIRALIECKAADIGVTDYVRGVGQVLQYEYFCDEQISPKGHPFSVKFNTILLFPSSVIKNNLFNIGRFKYPQSSILIEINEVNKVARVISSNELKELGSALDNDLTTISQYYIRDNRMFELYLLLRYLIYLKLKGQLQISRTELEEKYLRLLETPNNRNWRNAFISLSSLGFIDSNNLPTPSGNRMGALDYEEFLLMMYKSYVKPYVDTLLKYFNNDEANLSKSNSEICRDIKKDFSDKDVLFLTQSDGRYMSSWLNIIRDDFGCMDFSPRNHDRKMIYNISELNEKSIIRYIKDNTKASAYLDKFNILTSN
jgi:hypothetical protein